MSPIPTQRQAIEDAEVAQLVEASRFLLVDFAEFLVTNMPAFWSALSSRQRPGDAGAGALYDALTSHRADPSSATTWRDALIAAWNTAAILYGDAAGTPAGGAEPGRLAAERRPARRARRRRVARAGAERRRQRGDVDPG